MMALSWVHGDDDDRVVEGTDTGVYNFLSVPTFSAMVGLDKKLSDDYGTIIVFNYRNHTRDTEGNRVSPAFTMDLNFSHHKPGASSRLDFSIKNLLDDESTIPEYARPGSALVDVPAMGYGREYIFTWTQKF
jgi:hypothetical protein